MCALDTYATHCVGEAWHDGAWHLYDPERRSFYLDADNTTIASYETLHKNPSLAVRTHDGGFAAKGLKSHGPDYQKYFPPKVMPVDADWVSTMAMVLRPGETFVWRWDHSRKYRCGHNMRNIRPGRPQGLLPYQLANGKLIYRPRLGGAALRRGVVSALNIEAPSTDSPRAFLRPKVPGTPGVVVYKVSSPYPIVGGIVGGRFLRRAEADACRVYVSVRDEDWTQVCSAVKTGSTEIYVAIDKVLNPKPTPAITCYYVKFELVADAEGAARLLGATIETDVQMSATALPALSAGLNRVGYRDESGSSRRVRITHGWRESSATRPPAPPARPVAPANGSRVALASLEGLAWQAASDPEGAPPADYRIQVSPRRDMRHPVSPNFDRLSFSGEPRWPLPQGWLLAGRTYYWRVRARDDWGAWSPWSETWTFTVAE